MLPRIDIISGGFPCQDISIAGHGKGLEGKRSGLIFEVFRLIAETNPSFVFLENVPAIRTRGGERVGKELASIGYDCRWTTLSAAEVGAPHKRERWFLLGARRDLSTDPRSVQLWDEQGRICGSSGEGRAFPGDDGETGDASSDTHGVRQLQPKGRFSNIRRRPGRRRTEALADPQSNGRGQGRPESDDRRAAKFGCPSGQGVGLADTRSKRLEGRGYPFSAWSALRQLGSKGVEEWPSWIPLPTVRRGDAGFAHRVDRLRCLGNANPPQQYQEAFCRLLGIEVPEDD